MNISVQLIQRLGYDPMADLDHKALTERGADAYGWHVLLCCPSCGQPVFHDFEHDYFYPQPESMARSDLQSPGDSVACSTCSFVFTSDNIWECSRSPDTHSEYFLPLPEVHRRGVSWAVRSPVPASNDNTRNAQ